MNRRSSLCVMACLTVFCAAASSARSGQGAQNQGEPTGLEKWRLAVLAGDSAALTSLYSSAPGAQFFAPKKQPSSVADEVAFWSGWKAKGLTAIQVDILQEQSATAGTREVVFAAALTVRENGRPKKYYVRSAQAWARENPTVQWQIVAARRDATGRLKLPTDTKKDLYPAGVDARTEIAEAVRKAGSERKRILLDFGGNWCFDCHVLDEAFHSPEIAPLLARSFVVVHVDIGEYDKNLDIAKQYDIPLDRGVPTVAVLESDGKLLFSQKRGEFEAARSMAPEDILDFLNKWKPASAR